MSRWNDEDDGIYTEYTLTMRRYDNHDCVNDVSSTFRSKDENLDEVLEHATYFLQGCSFTYVKGLIADKESS